MLHKKISTWLSSYLDDSKLESFVVGISGGIDSAVVSTLCALSGRKTIVVSIPIQQNTDQLERAHSHIKWLKERYTNVESYEFDLTATFNTFNSLFSIENKLAMANSKSRMRMVTLYHLSCIYKGLVVGTGNKVEDFGIGFFTKYGDGGVDISPIGDLTKTEVRHLAKELQILDEIIKAKPTDGLWEDDRNDEDQIGATYEELEWAMNYSGNSENLFGRLKEVYYIYNKLNKINNHKMVEIPVFKK
jgi:NAD+ synthase